jgi:hypothetical protein
LAEKWASVEVYFLITDYADYAEKVKEMACKGGKERLK